MPPIIFINLYHTRLIRAANERSCTGRIAPRFSAFYVNMLGIAFITIVMDAFACHAGNENMTGAQAPCRIRVSTSFPADTVPAWPICSIAFATYVPGSSVYVAQKVFSLCLAALPLTAVLHPQCIPRKHYVCIPLRCNLNLTYADCLPPLNAICSCRTYCLRGNRSDRLRRAGLLYCPARIHYRIYCICRIPRYKPMNCDLADIILKASL